MIKTESTAIYWLFLFISIVLEVIGTSIMKASQTSFPVSGLITMYILIGLSYFTLSKAVLRLPVGTAYTIWEGVGLTLITLVSFFLLKEALSPTRLTAICLLITGSLLVHKGTSPV